MTPEPYDARLGGAQGPTVHSEDEALALGGPRPSKASHETLECWSLRVWASSSQSSNKEVDLDDHKVLSSSKQSQDSKPHQPRLAAAQPCCVFRQRSCIFNFTMKGVFLTFSLHITERGQDQWLLMENLNLQ